MKKFFLSIWYFFFGEPHTGNAVASMEKSLRKLEKAKAFQDEKHIRLNNAAAAATCASAVAKNEADRAQRVRDNLATILES